MIVTIRAFAKINLTLRVVGRRGDGYHELRTTFQSIAIDDRLTLEETRGPFEITCADPVCPAGAENIVWKAAQQLWTKAGRAGEPGGVRVHIEKRIPMAAGLGGGSADAAAALRALALLWRVPHDKRVMHEAAAELGADVPFLLRGGTALGVNRGDVLVPLPDIVRQWLVVAVPRFGVSTKDAYAWFDSACSADSALNVVRKVGVGNDLEPPVAARYPEIRRVTAVLKKGGAAYAAMTGSGSAVFGLFATKPAAEAAADVLVARRWDLRPAIAAIVVTRTLSRAEHARLARPVLARK